MSPTPLRVYLARTAAHLAAGHFPGRWYFRPLELTDRAAPASPAYVGMTEAVAAACELQARDASLGRFHELALIPPRAAAAQQHPSACGCAACVAGDTDLTRYDLIPSRYQGVA